MRHGESTHNVMGILASSSSPGLHLTEKGVLQVEIAAEALQGQNIDYIYVSPVYRTLQSAKILGKIHSMSPERYRVHEALKEIYTGELEGRPYEEYLRLLAGAEDKYQARAPGGETPLEVMIRSKKALEQILANHADQTIMVMTHSLNVALFHKLLTGDLGKMPTQAEYYIYE